MGMPLIVGRSGLMGRVMIMGKIRVWPRVGAAVVLLSSIVGCSSGHDLPDGGSKRSIQALGEGADASSALDLLTELRRRFSHTVVPSHVMVPGTAAGRQRTSRSVTPLGSGNKSALQRAAQLEASSLASARTPNPDDLHPKENARAMLSLDAAVPSAFALSDGGRRLVVSGRLTGLAAVEPATVDGYVIWQHAVGTDAHLLRRFQDDGFEDFVALERAPENPQIEYSIRLGPDVAGLRLVADTLEFLDAGGAPRLRVVRPSIFSSDGTEHEGHLDVGGCTADRDPAAPWGRRVVSPGAAECTLRLTWDAEAVTYPALVDPSWVTTSDMIEARANHTANVLPSGKVLVVGGESGATIRQSVELYDPTTKTWAATGKLLQGRTEHTSQVLPDGRVLVVAGVTAAAILATSETYSESTGTWTQAGNLSHARLLGMGTRLADGRVLVTGGYDDLGTSASTEIFNPQTNAWSTAASMSTGRGGANAITLADGRVLVAGGVSLGSSLPSFLATAEIYTPMTNSWAVTGSMAAPRGDYVGRLLPDGTVLVATGVSQVEPNVLISTVEVFNPATGVWRTSSGNVPTLSGLASATLLSTGSMVVTGGLDPTEVAFPSAWLYDLSSGVALWHQLPRLASARAFHTATSLDATHVLVAGGVDETGQTTNGVEVLSLAPQERSEGAVPSRTITMAWRQPMVSPPSNHPAMDIAFHNGSTTTSVRGTLRVVAWTPDGRKITTNTRTITIPPCRTVTGAPCPQTLAATGAQAGAMVGTDWIESLTPNDLPSQPLEHEGVFHAEFVPTGAGATGFTVGTSNISYTFHANFGLLQLFGEQGSESLRPAKSYTSTSDYLTDLTPYLTTLEQPITGRIWNGTAWEDMRTGLPHDTDYELGGSIRVSGPFNPIQPEFGPKEDLYALLFPPKAVEYPPIVAPTGFRKVCAVFTPDFRDGNRGETYNNDTPLPASFARATLYASSLVQDANGHFVRIPMWSGQLDIDGCTPPVYLEVAFYTLQVRSDFKETSTSGAVRTITAQEKANGDPKVGTWMVSFSNFIPTFGVRPPITLSIPPSLVGNVGALAGRLLRIGDDGLALQHLSKDDPGFGYYTATIYPSPDDCSVAGLDVGAYSGAGGIRYCPDADAKPGDHTAFYKFVLGHEFGHAIEQVGGEIPDPDRSDVYTYKDQNLPQLCRCDPFVPRGNALHCLQSQEVYAAGSKEGFGHYFATRAWNDPDAVSPRFQYYKQFMEPSGIIDAPGMKVVNVRQTPIKWSDTFCSATAAGRSTEYDFLGFYWDILTQGGEDRLTLADFQNVMKALKTSSLDPDHEGSWAAYLAAAKAALGSGSPKANRFEENGLKFGVDH